MHAISKWAHMQRWQRELGLTVDTKRGSDGTVYVFSRADQGAVFNARGWREAEAFAAGVETQQKGGHNGNA